MNLTHSGTLSGTTTVAAVLSSLASDRTAYDLPDHTVREPRVHIFSRKLPPAGGTGYAESTVKTVFGDLNADGTSRSGNVIVTTTIRVPMDQELALATEALLHHSGVVRDTTLTAPMIEDCRIPYAA